MDQPPLGHKEPLPGRGRLLWCPACRGLLESPVPLTSRHVLEDCMAVEACRIREGVRDFFKSCRFAGVSQCRAYKLFLNGMGPDGTKVPRSEHLHRGASLIRLTQTWLNTWEWNTIIHHCTFYLNSPPHAYSKWYCNVNLVLFSIFRPKFVLVYTFNIQKSSLLNL